MFKRYENRAVKCMHFFFIGEEQNAYNHFCQCRSLNRRLAIHENYTLSRRTEYRFNKRNFRITKTIRIVH